MSIPLVPVTCGWCGTQASVPKNYASPRRFCSLKCARLFDGAKREAKRGPQLFWTRVDKDGTGGCWLWTSTKRPNGYGVFRMRGKAHYSHRLSYQWAHGPIPQGLHVCHKCDVPACVNPDHLFAGTASDNIQDMLAKGRSDRRAAAAKTRATRLAKPNCRFGHPFDGMLPSGKRYCKTCTRRNGVLSKARAKLREAAALAAQQA